MSFGTPVKTRDSRQGFVMESTIASIGETPQAWFLVALNETGELAWFKDSELAFDVRTAREMEMAAARAASSLIQFPTR